MGLFLALFIGFLVAGNISDKSNKIQEDKKIQTNVIKTTKNKSTIAKVKTQSEKSKSIVETTKADPKKIEPNIEEVKVEPKKIESTIKEVITESKKIESTIEEVITESKKIEPIVKEEKTELIKQEANDVNNLDDPGTSWFRLLLYILSPILVIVLGKYLYNKMRKITSSSHKADYMRTEFKTEAQPDTTEQQSTQEEAQPDTTEQQSTQEEDEDREK